MPHRRTRRSLVALTALLALATGCSDDPSDDDADQAKDSPSATPPSTGADPATDPNGPAVVAASAVAERSVDQVTQLHVMGTSTVQSNDLPVEQIPLLAKAIRTELGKQIDDASMMTPPKGSAAADLVATLDTYRGLATELRNWNPDGSPMPDDWFDRLRRTDKDWKAALEALGELSGTDLIGLVPPLMLPTPK